MLNIHSLGAIAGFLLFIGVLLVMMASSQAKKDGRGFRIPPERMQMLSLVCFIGAVALFAYILYGKAFG